MINMRKLFFVIIMLVPLAASAQDNTWEKIEQEPVENPDAKYLNPDAIPVSDGKVCFNKDFYSFDELMECKE